MSSITLTKAAAPPPHHQKPAFILNDEQKLYSKTPNTAAGGSGRLQGQQGGSLQIRSSNNNPHNIKKRISIQQVNVQPNQQSFNNQHPKINSQHHFRPVPQPNTIAACFDPNKLNQISSKPRPSVELQQPQQPNNLIESSRNGCVAFQFETDGRSTFPNQKDFHDFCKQRDLFYGIKEIWTTQQSEKQQPQPRMTSASSNSNYDPAFGKMRLLFQLNSSPTNMNRLATLFLSQCILDSVFCTNQVGKNNELGSSVVGGASSRMNHSNIENQKAENSVRKFLQSNPSRLEQLRNRVAPNPEASEIDFVQINDPMAFLKYFIGSAASTSIFIQYLIDQAIFELSEVENTIETEGLPTEPKDILDLIQKTTLLGKMLGYLYYLPYVSKLNNKPLAVTSYEQQATLRSYQAPPLDIYSIILKSIQQRRTIITLPWIVELLAQADPVVQYLPKYESSFNLMSLLYHTYLLHNPGKEDAKAKDFSMDSQNRKFLCLYIENLLGFVVGKNNIISKAALDEMAKATLSSSTNSEHNELTNESLDSQSFIGITLIPICFPTSHQQTKTTDLCYSVDEFPPLGKMSEYKVPNSPFPDRIATNHNNQAVKPPPTDGIQELLETQFYKIHPASMKKTIEFIAERIASKFVKSLRNNLLLTIKQELNSLGIFMEEAVSTCKQRINVQQKEFCSAHCKECLQLLLDDSLSEGVKSTCCSISTRKAGDKITKWVNQHITKDLFPVVEAIETPNQKEKTEPNKVPQPTEVKPSKSYMDLLQLHQLQFQCLILLQRSIKKLHSNLPLTPAEIEQILGNIPIISNVKPWTRNSIINFFLALITFQPTDFTDKLQSKLIQTWKLEWDIEEDSPKILCPRNLLLLAQSKQPHETWSKFGSFLKLLIENKMLTLEDLQEYCVTVLLRYDWPSQVTQHISKMLSFLKLESHLSNDSDANIINWAEWFYSGRDDESF